MPAADAAVRIARALGTTVEALLAPSEPGRPPEPVLGGRLREGEPVRVARVGERLLAVGAGAFEPADGLVRGEAVALFAGAAPRGAVVAGCDPLLRLAERELGHPGDARLVGVTATSGEARAALDDGRCHGALVHGPAGSLRPPAGVRRWAVAAWRSGIGSHSRLRRPSLEALLASGLVGRAASAASQQAVQRAARRLGAPLRAPSLVAAGHLEAARTAVEREGAAVTIEPVARAAGLDFLALEEHATELWVPERWVAHPGVHALLDLLASAAFRARAAALPAYDVTDLGAAR